MRKRVRGRRRPASPAAWLRGATDLSVGRQSAGQSLAYRDGNDELLARIEVTDRRGESKLGAVLAGDDSQHIDERWTVDGKTWAA